MLTQQRTVEEIMLGDPERKWEVHRGRLREKPLMTMPHNRIGIRLVLQVGPQLDLDRVDIRVDTGRVRQGNSTYYIPDVYIAPVPNSGTIRDYPGGLEVFDEPLLLVVEIWSPSTGDYDAEEKLPVYMERGDLEIWRLHPMELTLTAWRRQPDGSYVESLHRGGSVELAALPGVRVDLDALFL